MWFVTQDCRVPSGYAKDPELAECVQKLRAQRCKSVQRQFANKITFEKAVQLNGLNKEKLSKLEALGFCWYEFLPEYNR